MNPPEKSMVRTSKSAAQDVIDLLWRDPDLGTDSFEVISLIKQIQNVVLQDDTQCG
jgi:hypothetical protein